MIIAARQALTANRCAPRQQRSTYAAQRLRSLFGPSIRLWLDGSIDQQPIGGAVAQAQDQSGLGVAITQTVVASRPLRSVVQNVSGWTFDALDDRLNTAAVNLSGANKATLVCVHRLAVAGTAGILLEVGNGAAVNGGIQFFRTATGRFSGNSYTGVSYNAKDAASSVGVWLSQTVVLDRSLPAASETTLYQNGAAVAMTTLASADLSANFENRASTIGGWAASAATINGQIAQMIVLTGSLTAARVAEISLLAMQTAGVA